MVGVVTLKEINLILDEYGLLAAIKASVWQGTYLDFLVKNNLW